MEPARCQGVHFQPLLTEKHSRWLKNLCQDYPPRSNNSPRTNMLCRVSTSQLQIMIARSWHLKDTQSVVQGFYAFRSNMRSIARITAFHEAYAP